PEWDRHAEEYAQLPVQGLMRIPHLKILAAMNAATPFASATSIVDVGCGTGNVLDTLMDEYGSQIPAGARLIASDFSQGMVDVVRRRKMEQADNQLWQQVEPVVCDAADLHGISDGSASHVMGNMVYFVLPDPRKGLAEAHRVL